MSEQHGRASGSFKIGGAIEVNRLGFGAMRIVAKACGRSSGPRREPPRLPPRAELGINFIDTAHSYGPF